MVPFSSLITGWVEGLHELARGRVPFLVGLALLVLALVLVKLLTRLRPS